MSDKKPENPGAFAHGGNDEFHPQCGMTLRDYFAAAALQGFVSLENVSAIGDNETIEGIAETAYELADAMLKARQP